MKQKLLKIIKYAGFTLAGLGLLYLAFKKINFEDVIEGLKTANYWWILLSLFFSLLAFISRAIRWNLLIDPLGYHPKSINTFYSLMVGYMANFALPRIGEVTRCASLSKKEKIPVDKLLGTVIIERAIDLFSLIFLLLVLIFFRFETFGSFLQDSILIPLSEKLSKTLNLSNYIFIGGGLFLVLLVFAYYIFREELSRVGIIIKMKNLVKGVLEGLKTVYKMKRRWSFLFHTIFIWFNYLMMTWVVVFAIPATSQLTIVDGLFLLIIGGLGMSTPVQGGMGAYHWIVSRGLFAVYQNITIEDGLVFAVLSHESQLVLIILLGIISFDHLLRKPKKEETI